MFPARVIIAGATGLIGRKLTSMFISSPSVSSITVLTRRDAGFDSSKVRELIIDYDKISSLVPEFEADAAYCCLGTTMKNAGSREAFYQVDHDYVVEFARTAKNAGINRFFVITAMGADEGSMFFYNRVKGKTEKDLKAIGFSELHILRPSLLLGDRKENRSGEAIGQKVMNAISFLLVGPFRKYRPIRDTTVARAMLVLSERESNGIFVHDSAEIQKTGKS